jgi:hypothetical protein
VRIVPIKLTLSLSLYYLACDVLCTMCRVLEDVIIGCMVVPLKYIILVVDVFILLD